MISSSNPNPMPLPPDLPSHPSSGKGGTLRSAPLKPAADAKLQRAAGEFESMLLSNLWKSMKSTFASEDSEDSEDSESTDPARDSFDQMGIDAMSSAVGKAGGLGLGRLILQHLAPKLPPPSPTSSSDH